MCQRRIQVSISGDVKRESYDIKWHQISYGDWMSLQVEWLRLQDVVMPEAMAVHGRSRPRSMYNEYSISFYYDVVVRGSCLPFVSSSPTPDITINFSTTAPQHMLPTPQMSCPITFLHPTLTHFTFNFPLTIFLIIRLLFFPM